MLQSEKKASKLAWSLTFVAKSSEASNVELLLRVGATSWPLRTALVTFSISEKMRLSQLGRVTQQVQQLVSQCWDARSLNAACGHYSAHTALVTQFGNRGPPHQSAGASGGVSDLINI